MRAGDCHAAQGDGGEHQWYGSSHEVVTVRVELIKDAPLESPYLVTPGDLVSPRYREKPFHAFIESEKIRGNCARVSLEERYAIYRSRRSFPAAGIRNLLCGFGLEGQSVGQRTDHDDYRLFALKQSSIENPDSFSYLAILISDIHTQ